MNTTDFRTKLLYSVVVRLSYSCYKLSLLAGSGYNPRATTYSTFLTVGTTSKCLKPNVKQKWALLGLQNKDCVLFSTSTLDQWLCTLFLSTTFGFELESFGRRGPRPSYPLSMVASVFYIYENKKNKKKGSGDDGEWRDLRVPDKNDVAYT